MSYEKIFCLRCEKTNACSCGSTDKQFRVYHKLRPPTSTRNKARFREFLRKCPVFVNSVPPELYEDFRQLLIKVKWFDQEINGHRWTYIPKDSLSRKRRVNEGFKAAVEYLNKEIRYLEDSIKRALERMDTLRDGVEEDEKMMSYIEDNILMYKDEISKLEDRIHNIEGIFYE